MKTINAIMIVLLMLIIWMGFTLLFAAFIKAEINPFKWTNSDRAVIVFLWAIYLCFTPVVVYLLKNEQQ